MLLVHFRNLPVREPDPWRGSRYEREANLPPIMCPGCGEVEVSAEDQHCAECEIEHTCANCGGRIDPGDVYCDEDCRREAEVYAAGDARNDLEDAP